MDRPLSCQVRLTEVETQESPFLRGNSDNGNAFTQSSESNIECLWKVGLAFSFIVTRSVPWQVDGLVVQQQNRKIQNAFPLEYNVQLNFSTDLLSVDTYENGSLFFLIIFLYFTEFLFSWHSKCLNDVVNRRAGLCFLLTVT